MQTTYFPPGIDPVHPRLVGRDFQDPQLKTRPRWSFLARVGTLVLAILIAFAPSFTTVLFGPAARLILPMLYWVAFAASLNLYILLAN